MNNQQPPKTISEKEKEILRFWEENNIFEKSVITPAGGSPKGNFSFYDGPPFATGLPHYGHILAGTIKDAIPRYHTMKGNSVRRVWGWDCHGLPIENLIEKKLGLKSKKDIEEFGIDKFNKDAYESVLQYEEEWRDIIPRLGRWVDMDRPYKTMDATYTESIWWAWKSLYEKGLAYEGNKMMHVCPRCETTLAQSEVGMNYEDVTDLSVTAKFELVDEPGTYILAWTTTPWTLPGNTALAVNKDIVYVKIKTTIISGEGVIGVGHQLPNVYSCIVAKKVFLAEATIFDQNNSSTILYRYHDKDSVFKIVEEFTGDKLIGKSYKPPFTYFENADIENKENIWKIWHADFITDDAGTGIAHEAPAFGADDMELAKANNIPVIKHVKMDGTFIGAVTNFAGMKVKVAGDTQSADIKIIKWLAHNGKLFEKHKIIHSYPLCWRCKTPLLNYATSSWFMDVPKIKDKLLRENAHIGWTPSHTRDGRFGKWLEGAREWAVSRSRYWGAPLPVWKNADGSKIKVLGSLSELATLNVKQPKNSYYAMRHGESLFNISDRLDALGDTTNILTENGRQQAKETAQKIKALGVDVIISSPLIRTKETAHIIGEEIGVAFEADGRLSEFDFGDYKDMPASEFRAIKSIHTDLYKKVPKGESFKDGASRFMQVVASCEEKYAGKKILFVTHGSMAYMGTHEAQLSTCEAIIGYDEHHGINILNGQVVPFVPMMVPRDETGAVNLHRPYIDEIKLSIDGEEYHRIPDVFDCWFESGSMPFASVHYPFENKEIFDKNYPADFIAEGVDQTRGWFYSLINLGVGLFDKAPYKHVIVNGFVMASSGVKLSKSERNYTDPMVLVEKYGADAMRYALLSSPVVKGENIQFDDEIVSDVYKKCISRLENVVQLYEMYKPENIVAGTSSSNVLDTWMISRVHELVERSTRGYESYLLDEAVRGIADIIDDISVWYTRRSRDRLKGDNGTEDQMYVYQTLTYVLQTLAKVMAPVMPFIAERVYKQARGEKESVHLESWPRAGEINNEVLKNMGATRAAASTALMLRVKANVPISQILSSTTIPAGEVVYEDILKDEVNVEKIVFGEKPDLDTNLTPDLIRKGDIRKLTRAIQDARKEKGLSPKDKIVVTLSLSHDLGNIDELIKTCNVIEVELVKEKQSISTKLSLGDVTFQLEAKD